MFPFSLPDPHIHAACPHPAAIPGSSFSVTDSADGLLGLLFPSMLAEMDSLRYIFLNLYKHMAENNLCNP